MDGLDDGIEGSGHDYITGAFCPLSSYFNPYSLFCYIILSNKNHYLDHCGNNLEGNRGRTRLP